MIKVYSDGRVAQATWYEIWEAVNAVAYMCINQRKEGRATRIGKYNDGVVKSIIAHHRPAGSLGNIRVDFFDEHPDLSQSLTDAHNLSLEVGLSLPKGSVGQVAETSAWPDTAPDFTLVRTNISTRIIPDGDRVGVNRIDTA